MIRDRGGRTAWRRRRAVTSFSLATKLAATALAIVLVSLAVVSVAGIRHGRELANDVNQRRIANIGASRAGQVELYMAGLRRQVALLARSPATPEAINGFTTALDDETSTPAERDALIGYYESVVVPDLLDVRSTPIGVSDLLPSSPIAIGLQARYVIDEDVLAPNTGTDSGLVAAGEAESSWDEFHDERHPVYRDIAAAAGFADLYLVDARSDFIVYSVEKGIDFATSLGVGPHSGSTLAGVVQAAMADPDAGVLTVDFAAYTPAGERPMLFVASAVVQGDTVVGAVAARIDTSGLNSIMTADGDWDGLGDTGETYLVGADDTMRSDARLLVESSARFLDRLEERSTIPTDGIRRIRELGTTVLVQSINDGALQLARSGETGSVETVNYLGVDVRSTYRSIDVDGVDWVLVTDVASSELARPVVDYARDLLVAIAVILVLVTFAIVFWSRRMVEPLRRISSRLRAARRHHHHLHDDDDHDDDDADARDRDAAIERAEADPMVRPPREFEALANDIEAILGNWRERRREIEDRSSERRELVRRFLPPGIVARVEAGEQDVIDQTEQATAVTVVIRGLGRIVDIDGSASPGVDSRDVVDRIVDAGDVLADRFGLDRVKMTGDSYTAICGATKPYLDHASRVVSFGLAVAEMVGDVAADVGIELSLGVGIESGPVTVGLTGGSGLVYDAWGATVSTSSNLARVARDGDIIVTATVRSQLPGTFELIDVVADSTGSDDRAGGAGLAVVTGALVDEGSDR